MEHRDSVLSSFDVFSNVPGTVLSILWMYKKKVQDKEHRNKGQRGRGRKEQGCDLQAYLKDKRSMSG